MWTVQCTMCTVECTVYSVDCSVNNVYSKVCSRGPDMSSIEAEWAEQENCVNHGYLHSEKKIYKLYTFKCIVCNSCIARKN